ncbi:unnamed protein product [Notodromas monacha]|uniref:HotDog ACOT-type domain-containing protein n=1 Tax=Notodromas monacha TaxID=399045 RepID=A0A7R9BME4_9CRUS|nr:unnamed protein product [Notodromas monacha]CAG0917277.1 unnamed protein product [Notodromas monacha]
MGLQKGKTTELKCSHNVVDDNKINDSLVTDAAFVFVSRDPVGLGPTPVNPLKIESPEDQHYFSKGAANTEMRKRFEENNLFRTLPNKEESELLHRQFLASVESRVFRGETDNRLVAARGGIYARDTQSENVMICHPEDKNLNNKIFGGRMMRQAFEHAWGVAMLHCRGRPRLVCIDDIWFRKPVDIGSLVQFVALVSSDTWDVYIVQAKRRSVKCFG